MVYPTRVAIEISIKMILGAISVLISAVGYIIYLRQILSKRTSAHALSWLVWSCLSSMVFAIQISNGAGAGAWPNGSAAVLSIIVFGVALRAGDLHIVATDWINFTIAGLALLIYLVAKDPLMSIMLIAAADFFGFLPTFRKSFIEPSRESSSVYVAGTIKSLLSILAIENYSVVAWLHPVSTVSVSLAFLIMLSVRRNQFTMQTRTLQPV